MFGQSNVKEHTNKVESFIAVQSRKSKDNAVIFALLVEDIASTNALTRKSAVRKYARARKSVLVDTNAFTNVNGFVTRNAFIQDYQENGSKNVDSLLARSHSRTVSIIAPKRSKKLLARKDAPKLQFHTNIASVPKSWYARKELKRSALLSIS